MQWSWSTLKKFIYNHLLLDFFKYKYVLLVLRSIMCISLKITSILKFGGKFFCKTQHWPFPLSGPSSWLYSTPYAHIDNGKILVHVYGHAINKYLHCWVFSLICTMQHGIVYYCLIMAMFGKGCSRHVLTLLLSLTVLTIKTKYL